MMVRFLVSLIGLSLLTLSACVTTGDQHIVSAPAGSISGASVDGLMVYKGIPYAQPPVGDLRWAAPQPLEAWGETLDANGFGRACVQPKVKNAASVYSTDIGLISEDCLTLNIWTPANAADAPVFVWIHGGAFRAGASKETLYDGAKMAEQGIIVVSLNYRLGILGYLAHPELSAESPDGVSGNYGLLDQMAALRWVQGNIAAFGGDASNVTVAGESSGGLSVMYLLASPEAKGLFAKAVVQSGYMVSTPALKESQFGEVVGETIGVDFAEALGGKDISEMREMSARTLLDKARKSKFTPLGTIDGTFLPKQLVEIFERGEQAAVPLLVGFNAGEIRSMRALAPLVPVNSSVYEPIIGRQYGDLAEDYLSLYPTEALKESILAATRDALYGWTSERLAINQTAIGQPAYLYIFDHAYPATEKAGLHSFHASELPFVFGTSDRTPPNWPEIPNTASEEEFSDAMLSYWASFARSGKPTSAGYPDWVPYGEDQNFMAFGASPEMKTNPLPGMYELHEEVVCRRRASGDMRWNWNVGLWSPVNPPAVAGCP